MVVRGSFASLHSSISVLAGLASLTGAVYSAMRWVSPAHGTVDVITVTRSESGDHPLPGGTVEILTRDDALLATLSTGKDGRARRSLRQGDYRLRVSAPHFAPETRDVRVEPDATSEVRFQLARRADGGAISRGVGAAGQFLRRFGL